ncbi:hypothetical protein HMPREF1210_03235 [Paenisporosarcina sp. HGH0030]|nr:hypothetical protein HMPREF1210_03235 [Paenisporosarcina sp. HGH0030]
MKAKSFICADTFLFFGVIEAIFKYFLRIKTKVKEICATWNAILSTWNLKVSTWTAIPNHNALEMADDLEKLPYTIQLSRKALRIIKENIMFALGLKIVALLLIIPGWLTLWIAIFADMGATLLVVLNSMRLLRIQK